MSRVAVVWIITCLIWSTVWLFIKIGVRDVPPVSFAVLRLLIAILVMVPLVLVARIQLPRRPRDWRLIAGTGVLLLGVNYALLNWGLQFVSSGLTAVLQSMTPAFALVFAHYLLPDERMTLRKVAGLALGTLGIGMVFWDQLQFGSERAFAGALTVTLGAICVALAYVLVRRGGKHLPPAVLTTGQMIAAFVPLVAYAWMVEGSPLEITWTRTAVQSALYLALAGSVLAAWLNYWLLARVGAVNLLIMGLIEPVIAILLGAWILDESIHIRAMFGGAVILASVWLAMVPAHQAAGGRPDQPMPPAHRRLHRPR